MELPDFDKIKINNALIVFLVVTACALLPLLIVFSVDPRIILSPHLIIYAICTIIAGLCEYAYIFIIIMVSSFALRTETDWEDPKYANAVVRMPAIIATPVLIIFYQLIIFYFLLAPADFHRLKGIILSFNGGFF